MTRKDQIRNAYRTTGGQASFYDGMMTYSTWLGKAICRVVWNMDGEKNAAYLEKALSGIPEDFSGKLLEVPVGTGVLTMPVWQSLPQAEITCLDYSPDMMASAQEKAKRLGIANVAFTQGDVGALPFADESFDIVLSLNGFHAFPDKEAAYRETYRVLKKGGTFCGCFYIQGECGRTDGASAGERTGSSGISISRKAFSPRLMKRKAVCGRGFPGCIRTPRSQLSRELAVSGAGSQGIEDSLMSRCLSGLLHRYYADRPCRCVLPRMRSEIRLDQHRRFGRRRTEGPDL